jgi:hypothetical protein
VTKGGEIWRIWDVQLGQRPESCFKHGLCEGVWKYLLKIKIGDRLWVAVGDSGRFHNVQLVIGIDQKIRYFDRPIQKAKRDNGRC